MKIINYKKNLKLNLKNKKMTDIKFSKENFIPFIKSSFTVKYEKKSTLGQGAFGVVYKVKNKITNQKYACKKIPKFNIKSKEEYEKLKSEITLLSKLDHPNISKIYEAYEDETSIYIIMEYCKGGELYKKMINLLEKGELLTEEAIAIIFKQVISVISYCHNHNICHRDIKPENILLIDDTLDFNNNIKVIDFGLSIYFKNGVNQKMNNSIGTIYYASPEVIDGNYSEKCDIWSCGILLYSLLVGTVPFKGRNRKEIINKIKEMKIPFTEEFNDISNEAKDLIKKMLVKENERISADDILKHPWFKIALKEKNDKQILKLNLNNLNNYVHMNKFEKMIRMYIASRLSHEEIKNMKNIFKEFDTNNNGTISIEELKEGLKKINKGNIENIDIEKMFSEIDTDKNGEISYTELLSSILDDSVFFQKDKLNEAFLALDKDNSGIISKEDLLNILKQDKEVDNSVIDLIKQLDSDKDGGINYNEFLNLIKK